MYGTLLPDCAWENLSLIRVESLKCFSCRSSDLLRLCLGLAVRLSTFSSSGFISGGQVYVEDHRYTTEDTSSHTEGEETQDDIVVNDIVVHDRSPSISICGRVDPREVGGKDEERY